jgi:hypothetical protein
MKSYKLRITETGRNSTRDESTMFNIVNDEFETIEECRNAIIDRYGKMPNKRRKIYIGPNNNPTVIGFLHSFWNSDISHNSKPWFQTDWIEVYEITSIPIQL